MGITTGKRRANRRNALKSTGLKSLNGKAAWPNKGKSEKQSQISLSVKGLFIWLLALGGLLFIRKFRRLKRLRAVEVGACLK